MFIRFAIFGLLGLLATLVFTGIRGAVSKRGFDLTGSASLVLFPAFGLIAIVYPIVAIRVGNLPWYGRAIVYTLAFYIAQYAIGWVLTKLRICPWRYPPGGSLGGLVRITDAPVWFACGLGTEWIYPYVKIVANALG